MRRASSPITAIDRAASALVERHERIVLAVSGGIDSIVLLHAVAAALKRRRVPAEQRIVVATFDHGTGVAAAAAVRLVERSARALDLPVHTGHADTSASASREAGWRTARWHFLREVAREERAVVATAHTLDDHIETVVMRILRGSGGRGLAGLLADTGVERPLLQVTRRSVEQYARDYELAWVDDPSNTSRVHLRNRVRLDLLPAIDLVRPAFRRELFDLSRRAAAVRAGIERAAEGLVSTSKQGETLVDLRVLTFPEPARAELWPALLARAGVIADRRGNARLCAEAGALRVSERIPLSAGGEVVRRRDGFLLRRRKASNAEPYVVSLQSVASLGLWQFRRLGEPQNELIPVPNATLHSRDDSWFAYLPAAARLEVRPWRPGDRVLVDASGTLRRVKRFFADCGISAPEREGWPVVLVDGAIVWIPGIRRTRAATERSGGPYLLYHCERRAG